MAASPLTRARAACIRPTTRIGRNPALKAHCRHRYITISSALCKRKKRDRLFHFSVFFPFLLFPRVWRCPECCHPPGGLEAFWRAPPATSSRRPRRLLSASCTASLLSALAYTCTVDSEPRTIDYAESFLRERTAYNGVAPPNTLVPPLPQMPVDICHDTKMSPTSTSHQPSHPPARMRPRLEPRALGASRTLGSN
ncbi:hypothetical protein F4780DRAFT_622034 [Xylariomycetidae sp. FL0641]|nr:hypothetical protein F4780DRAFT_622034 [Xylariomycetidae sp. FL0641]